MNHLVEPIFDSVRADQRREDRPMNTQPNTAPPSDPVEWLVWQCQRARDEALRLRVRADDLEAFAARLEAMARRERTDPTPPVGTPILTPATSMPTAPTVPATPSRTVTDPAAPAAAEPDAESERAPAVPAAADGEGNGGTTPWR